MDNDTCVIIPCYNNVKTVGDVVKSVLEYTENVIVVFDGCTDGSQKCVSNVHTIDYQPNKGKGKALETAFSYAIERGFKYAITMDADGQHYADDLPKFFEAIENQKGAMIMGCRQMKQDNKPAANTFANKFSNFWFAIQTGRKISDTQTGFRAYPLYKMGRIRLFSSRYEGELEFIIRIAWKNIRFYSIPINVYYPPVNERVTHFRKGTDFTRISILNTIMCFVSILYGYPSRFFHYVFDKKEK